MMVDSISITKNLKYLSLRKSIKKNNYIINENTISIKTDSEIIISFRFNKKITKTDKKSFDNLMEVLKSMAKELTKIAKEKGRKRITVVFDDSESAVKIASFEKGKYFKQYLATINMIMLTDEIIYKDDKDIKYYTIKPKVKDYIVKTKTEYYKPRTITIKLANNTVRKAYSKEIITLSKEL